MNGSEKIDPKSNASPNTKYNLASVGRGTSDIVQKGEKGLLGGPQEQYKMKPAGTGRFTLTDRSLNTRKM